MSDVDILYIHPSRRLDLPMFNVMPMGVAGLMNLLRRRGYKVRGINCGLEKRLNPDFHLENWLANCHPRIIFIDLHWYEHSFGAIEVAGVCKKVHPKVPVVLGGITASIFSREILNSFEEIDFILRGDCEEPIVELVDALLRSNEPGLKYIPNLAWRNNETVVENKQTFTLTSFDGIDPVSIDFVDHWQAYYHMGISDFTEFGSGFWLPIARGCEFECCFCGGSRDPQRRIYKRKRLILRDLEDVHQDIRHLARIGITRVNLSHDPACIGEDYWREFFDILGDDASSLGVYLELFQLPSISFLKALFKVFDVNKSILIFTPLSGNEEVRKKGGKDFTNDEFLRIMRYCKSIGVQVGVYFSSNLPFEDVHTFQESINLARSLVHMYPPDKLFIINQPIALDPECPMYKEPDKFGIKRHFKSFRDYYEYCRDNKDKVKHSDNGFFSTHIDRATLNKMYFTWKIEIGFEKLQRFPWYEVREEMGPNGVNLVYDDIRIPVTTVALDLFRFLKNINQTVSFSDVGSVWPIDSISNAIVELNVLITKSYNKSRRENKGASSGTEHGIDAMLVMPPDPSSILNDLSPPLQSLGIAYIGSYLHSKGFSVALFDTHLDSLSTDKIAEAIISLQPTVLGLSVPSRESLAEVLHILKSANARGLCPKLVVLGGHFATVADKKILESFPSIDCIVRGEGEETLLELVHAVLKGKDWRDIEGISYNDAEAVIRNPGRKAVIELDKYPFPFRDYSISSLKRVGGVASILSSRGCLGSCYFCASKRLQKEHKGLIWRSRSAKAVVDEIQLLVDKYGVMYFQFVDDCFLGTGKKGSDRAIEIAREIKRRGLRVNFSIEARCDTVSRSRNVLHELKRAGLTGVTLGVESGVDRALKTFNKRTTVQDNLKAIQVLQDLKLQTNIGFIFFDPYATIEDLWKNLRFLYRTRDINPNIGFPRLFTELLIFEGTPIKEQLEKDGLLQGDWFNGYTYKFVDERTELAYHLWKSFETARLDILSSLGIPFSSRKEMFDLKTKILDPWDLEAMGGILTFIEDCEDISCKKADIFLSQLVHKQSNTLIFSLNLCDLGGIL